MSQIFLPDIGWSDVAPGMKVIFHSKVFEKPYAPYYDVYKNHMFEIVAFHHKGTHVEVKCVSDPNIKVNGCVHPDELQVPWQKQSKC